MFLNDNTYDSYSLEHVRIGDINKHLKICKNNGTIRRLNFNLRFHDVKVLMFERIRQQKKVSRFVDVQVRSRHDERNIYFNGVLTSAVGR